MFGQGHRTRRVDAGRPVRIPASRSFAFTCCLLADLALLLDSSTRWYVGLGFLRSLEWYRNTVPLGVAFGISSALLLRFELPGWVHSLVAFVLLACAVVISGSGSGLIDWRELPVASRILEQGWDDVLLSDGFRTPLGAALFHGFSGWFVRRERRRPSWGWPEVALVVYGLGLVLLARVAKADLMIMYPDPRLAQFTPGPTPLLPELPAARASFWGVIRALGFGLAALGALLRIVRLFWLERVRRGRILEFSLRAPSPGSNIASLPAIVRLPFTKDVRLLIHRTPTGDEPLAQVIG